MLVVEGYGLSFKDLLKKAEKEVKKGATKLFRVTVPLYIGKKLGYPEEELKRAIIAKELERKRKISVPVEAAQVPAEPVPQQVKPSTGQNLLPILLIGVPAVISLIFILRRQAR